MLRKQFNRKPFQHQSDPADKNAVILKVVANAKQTGKLNISSLRIRQLPEVLFNDETSRSKDISFDSSENKWWEVVELSKIIAADNLIQTLDPRIVFFHGLKVLDLRNNQLFELPDEIGALENLQLLNLTANKLTTIPSSLCRLPLLELHLSDNDVAVIPGDIDSCGTLQILNLSGNKIEKMPQINDTSPSLTHLTSLNVSSNHLSDLSGFNFNKLSKLVDLSLAKNKLLAFPSVNLPSLQILDLKHNDMPELISTLNCAMLKDVSLGFNKISRFSPDCFSLCKNLEVLDIRDNNVPAVPPEILKMYNLRRLDLSNNSISRLPPELSLLKYLVAIHLSGNPLRGLPTTGGTAKLLEFLSMKLEVEPGEEVKEELPYKPNASGKSIDWVNVKLQSFKVEDIQDACEQPTSLNLSQNQISSLPPNFDQISTKLNTIDLSKNKFTIFPVFLNCECLITLDLSQNQINQFPDVLIQIPKLNSLNLNHNRLTYLPTRFFEGLSSLSVLLLSNNQLTTVNMEALEKLHSLKTLDLGNNDIKMVPPTLGKLDLTHLQLLGNSFRIPRADVLQKGTSAVLQYLRDRIAN